MDEIVLLGFKQLDMTQQQAYSPYVTWLEIPKVNAHLKHDTAIKMIRNSRPQFSNYHI